MKVKSLKILRPIILTLLIIVSASSHHSHAFSLSLDSIAAMGRFPKFCVDTYRWGNTFFNGYDSTYVDGTGYKFNIKLRTDSWLDAYKFDFGDGVWMNMTSRPCTSTGLYLTYMAVSVGYDLNVSKYFGGSKRARKRWNFQFSCMLFEAGLYFISNDVGSEIRQFGYDDTTLKDHIKFDGINTTEWGLNLCYFFRHKRYSQAAAFNFSRIQRRTSWAPFAGISYWRQKYDFNFGSLPDTYLSHIPVSPPDYHYGVDTHNYFIQGGAGINVVLHPDWILGASDALMFGYSHGSIQATQTDRHTMAMLNDFKISVVFNKKQWFAGAIFEAQTGLVGNRRQTLLNSVLTFQVSTGYRFNLWPN